MTKKFIVRADIPKEAAIIIRNQPIVTPGHYYGVDLTEAAIKEHIRLTDWSNQYNKALIYGHKTNTKDEWVGNPSPNEWVGYYTVPEYKTENVPKPGAYSDIYVYDQSFASKLAYGGVRCGVSATFDMLNGGFRNLSIIDNPKCKDAFLNLSDDDEGKMVDISPQFLNLNDDLNLTIDERGKNSNIKMNDNDKNSDERIANLEKQIEELKALMTKKVEPEPTKTDPAPAEPTIVESVVEPVSQPTAPIEPAPAAPVVTEPKEPVKPADPAPAEPVEITAPTSNDSTVVDAIEKMATKVTEELKKTAAPQSVAPTDPNKQNENRDDEVTQSLVKKYESLHGLE